MYKLADAINRILYYKRYLIKLVKTVNFIIFATKFVASFLVYLNKRRYIDFFSSSITLLFSFISIKFSLLSLLLLIMIGLGCFFNFGFRERDLIFSIFFDNSRIVYSVVFDGQKVFLIFSSLFVYIRKRKLDRIVTRRSSSSVTRF